jgi:UDP-N-acetylmuramate--alanine ligase
VVNHQETGLCPLPSALSTTVHFAGIGGIAMSGLARVLLERGYRVGGCDLVPNRLTDELAARGATIYTGHDPAHLDGVDLLVISAAIRPGNPEREAAAARGIPTITAAELLGYLLDGLRTIAVAGTHGKTTTSSLAAAILLDAGLDPTAFIGGEVPALGGNVRGGHGAWAVAEADEYDRRFLSLTPEIAVVTNVEADHLDVYGDLEGVKAAFAAFVARIRADGALVACADDATAMQVASGAHCPVVTYGLDHAADWTAHDIAFDAEGTRCTVEGPCVTDLAVTTRLSGRHNVANVLAALAASALAGVAPADAVATLSRFELPRRRQEVKGYAAGGALILDDYAHHHSEIRATLAGLRARYPDRRLRVAFQPHTYTRTKAFLQETGASFGAADEVAVAEVYAARETETLGVSGRDVAEAARAAGVRATFTPGLDDVAAWLACDDGPDVVLVTMGAGDIWKAGETIADRGQKAAGQMTEGCE